MSMLETIGAVIAYKCDLCGELFSSADDAQNHNQDLHFQSVSNDEFGPWIMEQILLRKIENNKEQLKFPFL
jgi:hypothetical protein